LTTCNARAILFSAAAALLLDCHSRSPLSAVALAQRGSNLEVPVAPFGLTAIKSDTSPCSHAIAGVDLSISSTCNWLSLAARFLVLLSGPTLLPLSAPARRYRGPLHRRRRFNPRRGTHRQVRGEMKELPHRGPTSLSDYPHRSCERPSRRCGSGAL
jgi:hypothetical protein